VTDTTHGQPEKLLSTRDAAEALGLSVKRPERHRTDGTGPSYVKLSAGRSGRVRYRRADLKEWLVARVRASTSGAAATPPATSSD